MRQDLDKTLDGLPVPQTGLPQGPTHHILSPLAPTIRRIGPQSPCIVGAGEDVDVGKGPLWLPVCAHHHIFSPLLFSFLLENLAEWSLMPLMRCRVTVGVLLRLYVPPARRQMVSPVQRMYPGPITEVL